MKILILLSILISSFAQALDCEAGRMAKLTKTVEVSRGPRAYQLNPGTEVHVVAIEANQIEIYAMRDAKGVMINGYGKIPFENRSFLKCD